MKNLFLLLFTWWGNSTIGTWVHTKRFGTYVGRDSFGNRYYKQSVQKNASYRGVRKGERRWVIYARPSDASAVPPGWHGWLHYRTDLPPSEDEHVAWSWERDHQPNMTGTENAYRPSGSLLAAGGVANGPKDYDAWSP
ncbi:NADH:ubiquinone oxidoreductase subunit NDUFA12 [uncultured Cohaesibacter sp.]|uniref:NADH:ubiquinone oxidoreductase subunit NDUFA12 n=1 Tax=uncultured Cohaesibacter sp. TaxID=1002546 RepID=UPI00292F71AB|nr:NADH:ubiquinone oxidoreductase subunit NDUFA12 [uncultured Cohaesibacter sp.]